MMCICTWKEKYEKLHWIQRQYLIDKGGNKEDNQKLKTWSCNLDTARAFS